MTDVSLAATPGQLSTLIRGVQAEIRNGVLRTVPEPGGHGPPFEALPVGGPWPDVLAYAFECTACGRVFELSADTYHGGGQWAPRVPGPPHDRPRSLFRGRESRWVAQACNALVARFYSAPTP